jgi:hypothetical protein
MINNGSGAMVVMRSHPGGLKAVKLVKPIIATLPAVKIADRNERTPRSDTRWLAVDGPLVST